MNFGTLQSITKEPEKTPAVGLDDMHDELPGAVPSELGDEFDDAELGDELGDEFGDDKLTSVGHKLLSLRDEIDQILSDMGLNDEFDDADLGGDFGDEFGDSELGDDAVAGLGDETVGDELGGDLGGDDMGAGLGDELDDDLKKNSFLDEPEVTEPEDEDFQGDIRTVKGANLVYKRKTETGNYEELWIYKVGSDVQKEVVIRRAILAGTDIVPSHRESEDGTQEAETTTLGNVQYLKITGLPN